MQSSFQTGHHFVSFEQRRRTREPRLQGHDQSIIRYQYILEFYILRFGKL